LTRSFQDGAVDALPLRDVLSVVADPLPEDPELSARSFVLVAAGDAHMRGPAWVEDAPSEGDERAATPRPTRVLLRLRWSPARRAPRMP